MNNIPSRYIYMDVQLDFGEEYGSLGVEMDVDKFKPVITLALKTMFGDMGYAIPVDVLKYRETDRRAFIRVHASDATKVWSSLTLFSTYDGQECTFRIYKVTPVLSGLNLNSRLYEHETAEQCPDE